MNGDKSCKNIPLNKAIVFLVCSIAINIFLLAFVLGRSDLAGHRPPPPPFGGSEEMMMEPPPPMLNHDRSPPPPFFGPSSLFTPEEMRDGFKEMQHNFRKIQALRLAFARQLKIGAINKEDVLKHFSEIDQLMSDVRMKAQEKAATKISKLSPEERQKFADRLLSVDGD